jgi:5-methyltetrahydrofolate--homocysteine methyltransferase
MSILERLASSIVLFDGATGTQLISAGMKRGECSERYNLEQPEILAAIHRSYVEAGAEVISANSFGATRSNLEKHGLAGRLEEINRSAVSIARSAGPSKALVAGDVGPTGVMYPPVGKADDGLLEALFEEQVRALLYGRPDLILIETHYDLREALCAVRAVRRLSDLPLGAAMTFNLNRRGYFTMMGDSVEKCCKALEEAGADFIGANCTLGPADMVGLAEDFARHACVPVLLQPNAGQPKVVGDKVHYDITPRDFSENLSKIIDRGVRAVGGCCGTTPEFIRELRSMLEARPKAPLDSRL